MWCAICFAIPFVMASIVTLAQKWLIFGFLLSYFAGYVTKIVDTRAFILGMFIHSQLQFCFSWKCNFPIYMTHEEKSFSECLKRWTVKRRKYFNGEVLTWIMPTFDFRRFLQFPARTSNFKLYLILLKRL